MAQPGTSTRLGDVLEVPTAKGLAYLQFSYPPDILRVLPGLFPSRPKAFDQLAAGPERFFVLFDPSDAIALGIATVVGSESVPERCRKEPIFKFPEVDPPTGRVLYWTLREGHHEWDVEALTKDQEGYSLDGYPNAEELLSMIGSDYLPGGGAGELTAWLDDEEDLDRKPGVPPVARDSSGPTVEYYFYFPTRPAAEKAVSALRERNYDSELLTPLPGSTEWGVLARGEPSAESLADADPSMHALAQSLGGSYDGTGVGLE